MPHNDEKDKADALELLHKLRVETVSDTPKVKAASSAQEFGLGWLILWHAEYHIRGELKDHETARRVRGSAAFFAQFPTSKRNKLRRVS